MVDAVLLLSFGGPESPEDVMPFLENVTRGRDVPPERLRQVAQQYETFGGRSPINDQNRALLAALKDELRRRGHDVPLYWGNRNWEPYVEETLADMARDGRRSVVALATSAYSSYSSCRQYLEDIARARAHVAGLGLEVPDVVKVRPFWNHPGFIEAHADAVQAAFDEVENGDPDSTRLVFTAHSLPLLMAEESDYQAQLHDAAGLVAERLETDLDWDIAYQSRSGPPQVPWLEPDIIDHLRALASAGVTEVVVSPIGFVSDHMEVRYDLDVQAAAVARELGVTMVRASTPNSAPVFVSGLVDLLEEHIAGTEPKALGHLGVRGPCTPECCPAPKRRP